MSDEKNIQKLIINDEPVVPKYIKLVPPAPSKFPNHICKDTYYYNISPYPDNIYVLPDGTTKIVHRGIDFSLYPDNICVLPDRTTKIVHRGGIDFNFNK